MAYARGALNAWADAWGSDPDMVYDRLFEGARHALISLDHSMPEADRQAVRPVLDLLTGIKVSEPLPVATAVLTPGPGESPGACDWRLAYPDEFVVLTTAIPRMQVMARPLSKVAVCLARLVDILDATEVLPTCFALSLERVWLELSPLVPESGAMAQELWERLRVDGASGPCTGTF